LKDQETVSVLSETLIKRGIVKLIPEKFERLPQYKALAFEIQSKVVILLSEMAANKICE
jgi:hypothetical protein